MSLHMIFMILFLFGNLLPANQNDIKGLSLRNELLSSKSPSWLFLFSHYLPADHRHLSDEQLDDALADYLFLEETVKDRDSHKSKSESPPSQVDHSNPVPTVISKGPETDTQYYTGFDWKYSIQYSSYPSNGQIYLHDIASYTLGNDSFIFLFGQYRYNIPKQNIPNLGFQDNFVMKCNARTGEVIQTLSWGSVKDDTVAAGNFNPSSGILSTFGASYDYIPGSLTSRLSADTSYDAATINWNFLTSSVEFTQMAHSTSKSSDYFSNGQWFEDKLYIVGYSFGTWPAYTNAGSDSMLFRYSSSGTQEYDFHFGSTSTDYLYDIVVMKTIPGPEKNMSLLTPSELANVQGLPRIYMFGHTGADFVGSTPPHQVGYDATLYCYTENGTDLTLQWARNIGGDSSDYGYTLSVDPWGNSYVSGYTYSTSTFNGISLAGGFSGPNIYVAKIDINGNNVWTKVFQYSGNGMAQDSCIHFSSGSIVITGYNDGQLPGSQYSSLPGAYVPFMIRLDPSDGSSIGNTFQLGSTSTSGDLYSYSITCSESQGIQIAGRSYARHVPGAIIPSGHTGSYTDGFVIRFGGNLEYDAPIVKKPKEEVPFDWELFLYIFIPAFVLVSAISGLVFINRRQKQQLELEQERVRTAYRENPGESGGGTGGSRNDSPSARGFVSNFKNFTRTGDIGSLFGSSSQNRRPNNRLDSNERDDEAMLMTDLEPPLRLLSMDGGGIRGLALLTMIDVITQESFSIPEETNEQRIWQLFDFVGGSSTGGILCLALFVKKLTILATHDLYISLGNKVFKKSKMAKLKQIAGKGLYGNKLHSFLERYFGSDNMVGKYPDELPPMPLSFSVTANANNDPPSSFLIRNYTHEHEGLGGVGFVGSSSFQLFQAAVATSAAPTFFDIYKCQSPDTLQEYNFADGSIITNNPCRMVLYECKRKYPNRRISIILSLGTGSIDTLSSQNTAAGAERSALGWAKTMAKLVTSSQQVHEDMTRDFAGSDTYFRLSPHFKQEIDSFEFQMDDARPSTIDKIVNGTKYYMCSGTIARQIKSIGKKLMASRNEEKVLARIAKEKKLGIDTWAESTALMEDNQKDASGSGHFGFGKKKNKSEDEIARPFPDDINRKPVSSTVPNFAKASHSMYDSGDDTLSLLPQHSLSGGTLPSSLSLSPGTSLRQPKSSLLANISQGNINRKPGNPVSSGNTESSHTFPISLVSTNPKTPSSPVRPKSKFPQKPRPKPKPANPLGISDRSSIMAPVDHTKSTHRVTNSFDMISSNTQSSPDYKSPPPSIRSPKPKPRKSNPKPTQFNRNSGHSPDSVEDTTNTLSRPDKSPKSVINNKPKPSPKPKPSSKPKPKPLSIRSSASPRTSLSKPSVSSKPKPSSIRGSPSKPRRRVGSNPKPKPKLDTMYSVGQKIQAQWDDGNYYDATVQTVFPENKELVVTFDEYGTTSTLPFSKCQK